MILALPLLLAPVQTDAQAASDWREVSNIREGRMFVDAASIRHDGPWRTFTTRTQSDGRAGHRIGEAAIDCAAGIWETRAMREILDGKVVWAEVYKPEDRTKLSFGKDVKDFTIRLVCDS